MKLQRDDVDTQLTVDGVTKSEQSYGDEHHFGNSRLEENAFVVLGLFEFLPFSFLFMIIHIENEIQILES